jgi:hypothetical protein
MSRIAYVAREYWFELLIAVLLIAGIIQLVVLHDSAGRADDDAVVLDPACVLLAAALRAPALSLRRAGGLLGPGCRDHVRRRVLIAWVDSLEVVGLAARSCYGNLRDRQEGGIGLASSSAPC